MAPSKQLLRDHRQLRNVLEAFGRVLDAVEVGPQAGRAGTPDPENALAGIVNEMQKGGWEVMLRDKPRNPPLATLKLTTKDNKEVWASVEVFDTARVLVIEPGAR